MAQTRHRLTIGGVLFIGLTLLIGISAINTGTSLLYLIIGMLLAMLLVSGFLSRINLRKLRILRHYPHAFHAGEEVTGLVEVRNDKWLFRSYGLVILDRIEGPESSEKPERIELSAFTLQAPPRSGTYSTVKIRLSHRGLYRVHGARLTSRMPFGFFERSCINQTVNRIMAYPRLLPPIEIFSQLPSLSGDIEIARKGQGVSLFNIRGYEPGDPARQIHWKHSAKGMGLKIKEYEHEQRTSYRIMLDLRFPREPSDHLRVLFEKAVSATATLAQIIVSRNGMVGLWTSSGNVPLGNGLPHLHRIYQALSTVTPQTPDERPVKPEREKTEVTQIWVIYKGVVARPEAVMQTSANSEMIDVRRIESADPLPASQTID